MGAGGLTAKGHDGTVRQVSTADLEEMFGQVKECGGSEKDRRDGRTTWTCPNPAEFHVRFNCEDRTVVNAFLCPGCLAKIMKGQAKCGHCLQDITEWVRT